MTDLLWSEFERVDIRIGTIVAVADFPKARKPAYQLSIDFGSTLGIKQSSAQITELYSKDNLLGKQIAAVINFPPKQIANFISECLVLGIIGMTEGVVLLQPSQSVPNGSRIA